MTDQQTTAVLIVGGGIAGCAAALSAARKDADVTLATKARRPEDASTWWAQGGIAISRDDPEQFKQDIIDASAGTADPDAADVLVENANDAVRDVLVETLEVPFDTAESTEEAFDFGREAAHDEDRILHVDASTGSYVLERFLAFVDDHPDIRVLDDTAALDLITHEGEVRGASLESDGEVWPVFAGATVLATGGIGDLYPASTNPAGSTGDGIAMAALAGADIKDMEFVQFHPTVYVEDGETLLISEAVRGEGAVLRNGYGERFMPAYDEAAELAPRDVVARAVKRERRLSGEVLLDVSPVDFESRFPDLVEQCERRDIDWKSGIPVQPAQHFLCGGVAVDDRGRTSLDRLYAAGECAHTGVHGANRLASTSLLEGLVWGLRAGTAASGRAPAPMDVPDLDDRDPSLPDSFAREKFTRLRRVMDEAVGIERDPAELDGALSVLRRLKGEVDSYTRTRTSRSLYELRNASVVALLVARAAAENDESVGTHNLVEPDAPLAE
ncbi:FAD-dependent oxidoreductase [Halorhabdus sp. CBA1104]|uniref:L-aspartate oxidase n=1 Tax=unclassified Halorhabdus TaxID=2621901 RepID=UPI0012B3CC4B|nr:MULTISPECIES: FAD-dependent oxidoreductase [unclassified Halorhabdus]QGN06366.1 FAD-dependent oxidoreductase [Halorhabdus sp. CBA1104]